ncbi:MAG: AMP-binding protein [Acidobacteriota bacterium]|nr:AMP-binding protein [Acidobacteriota bacterium]
MAEQVVDGWIARKIGLPAGVPLSRPALEAWQARKLREVVAYVAARSAFHRRRLAGFDIEAEIRSVADVAKLPFTTPEDLTAHGAAMACLSASRISRVVTLPTTGTTGDPKRVYFTEADQELMTDYIHHGLQVMVRPGDVFLILFPCERPGSVGDLVRRGIERIGARGVPVGPIPLDGSRDAEVLDVMRREGVSTGVATAATAARLARKSAALVPGAGEGVRANMRTILLSAQYAPDEDVRAIESHWDCLAYEHYGMTEMGLGGAMACRERVGYHPREADILFEVIDPATGEVLPDGESGEIVFTTLTREAMPFVRYRTGDRSRWLPGGCPCGSVLKRLGKVGDRVGHKAY